ncbi:hypothetical protein NMG60_11019256 [Bertholletia excelsa]
MAQPPPSPIPCCIPRCSTVSNPPIPLVPGNLKNDVNHEDLNGKITLTALICASIVTLFVVALYLYSGWSLRRQARRRTTVLYRVTPGVSPRTGLDPAIISSLPYFPFEAAEEDATVTECAVCLSVLEGGQMARLLPNCKHTFHSDCIDRWLGSNSTCPVCRANARPRLEPDAREAAARAQVTGSALPVGLVSVAMEETSEGGIQSTAKIDRSSFRLNSLTRMISRGRSGGVTESRGQEDGPEDIERQ